MPVVIILTLIHTHIKKYYKNLTKIRVEKLQRIKHHYEQQQTKIKCQVKFILKNL